MTMHPQEEIALRLHKVIAERDAEIERLLAAIRAARRDLADNERLHADRKLRAALKGESHE